MEQGRELDAWIAEHVMGWQWFEHPTEDIAYFRLADRFVYGAVTNKARTNIEYMSALPAYSKDIGKAWHVIERFRHDDMYDHRAAFTNSVNALSITELTASEMAYQICEAARLAMDPMVSWDEIRKRFGHHFDNIDVDAFMREMRED